MCTVFHGLQPVTPTTSASALCAPAACRYKKYGGSEGTGAAASSLNRFPMCLLASDVGSDIGSDGWPGILQLKVGCVCGGGGVGWGVRGGGGGAVARGRGGPAPARPPPGAPPPPRPGRGGAPPPRRGGGGGL